MIRKNYLQKTALHVSAFFIMLALCLLSGIMPGKTSTDIAAGETTIPNPKYTLTATDGSRVATTANSGQTTVLIFGHTKCGNTRSTLTSISSSSWVKRSDIRVIFAETNGHSQEEVLAYKDGYQCPEMIFCYDESDILLRTMAAYANLLGMGSSGSYPMIVLIDQNNNIQNAMMGKTTADTLLNEIKKFAAIDENGSGSSSGSDSGTENISHALKTIEDATISTKANPNETTVLIFGYTTCGNTKSTLRYIDQSSWANRSDIRVIFADVYSASRSEVEEFSKNYTSGNIIFCYDESLLNYNLAFSYIGLDGHSGGTFPWIVLIDSNNKIQRIFLGPKTADEIIAEIEKFPKDETSEKKPDDSAILPAVSDVTGLKSNSAAKNIKLTWQKISNASGYIVYQYNNSKKTWIEKAKVNTNTPSYTIKGLTPATGYHFAVKAFFTSQNGTQITSNSYTSLYTATTPGVVNFKVTPGTKKASIKWKKVKGATGYTVFYKTKANGSWKKIKNVKKGLKLTKTKLKSGTTYYFTVKAYKTYKKKTYTGKFQSKKAVIK